MVRKMGHEIDLKGKLPRTDLAIDLITKEMDGVKKQVKEIGICKVTTVKIEKEAEAILNKKQGNYTTIEFEDITDHENEQQVLKIVTEELTKLLNKMKIPETASCLMVGLGNENSTPDALGPLAISHVLVTNHLFELGEVEKGFRKTYAIKPGVMGTTGMETRELLKGIVQEIRPDFMIVIDALASGSVERLNKTIQMTDTGIHPGSGVQNQRKEISTEYFSIPVLALGVPTVVDAATIVSDTIYYMQKNFAYTKEHLSKPSHKLSFGHENYLKKEVTIAPEDNEKLMGSLGSLSEEERKQYILEVLTPIGYNFIVTPKEIDYFVEKLGFLLGNALNHALHRNISFETE